MQRGGANPIEAEDVAGLDAAGFYNPTFQSLAPAASTSVADSKRSCFQLKSSNNPRSGSFHYAVDVGNPVDNGDGWGGRWTGQDTADSYTLTPVSLLKRLMIKLSPVIVTGLFLFTRHTFHQRNQ